MSIDDFFIARLSDNDIDNLAIFDCYNESEYKSIEYRVRKKIKGHSLDMNHFLINEAMDEQNEGYNTTFLVKNSDDFILAYMSLCSDAIKLDYSERDNGQIGYETFPSLKIARLAVHKDHQKSGLGKLLIGDHNNPISLRLHIDDYLDEI